MANKTACLTGPITSYFADHAMIQLRVTPEVEILVAVTPQTKFAGAFDDAKTFAKMREGMNVNVFFEGETLNKLKLAYVSPNLR